jgi:hypothetical protein
VQARGPWGISFLSILALFYAGYFGYSLVAIPLVLLGLLIGEVAAGVLGILLLLAIVGEFGFLLIRLWVRKRYAAVTHAGLQARTLFRMAFVPWDEFRYIQMYAFIPTIFAEGKQPYRVHLIGVFGSRRRFDEFDEASDAALQRYRASSQAT